MSSTSPKSLLNVALSSRSLYRLSRSLIYRVIHFRFHFSRSKKNRQLISKLLADDHLSNQVREISILWAPSAKLQPGEGSKADLELLGQVLPKLHRLKLFVWDCQYEMHSWLSKALQEQRPHCQLYIRLPRTPVSRTMPRLCDSPCLFALDVTLGGHQFHLIKELRKVLFSTPNLRHLTIDSDSEHLERLGYRRQENVEPLRLRSLELYGLIPDGIGYTIVWPMLERLSLDNVSSLPSGMWDFSGLKSLKLRIEGIRESLLLDTVLQSCKRLEALDLSGRISSIAENDIWERVGKTLTKLRLHEENVLDRVGSPAVLYSIVMGCIAGHCRNLRSLGLDLECNGKEWVSFISACPPDIQLKVSTATYDAQLYRG